MRHLLMAHCIVASAVAATLAPAAEAQSGSSPPATILATGRLKALDDSIPRTVLTSLALGRGSGYTYSLTHRVVTGSIELHMAWNDVFVIQSGSATLLTGGSLAEAKEASKGEFRDGVVTGGTPATVKPGDVVIIPAGTPHQFKLAAGEQVTYLAFKVAVEP